MITIIGKSIPTRITGELVKETPKSWLIKTDVGSSWFWKRYFYVSNEGIMT